jgi:hypothetical protein
VRLHRFREDFKVVPERVELLARVRFDGLREEPVGLQIGTDIPRTRFRQVVPSRARASLIVVRNGA